MFKKKKVLNKIKLPLLGQVALIMRHPQPILLLAFLFQNSETRLSVFQNGLSIEECRFPAAMKLFF